MLHTILQHEEMCLLRNAHMFQGLNTVATHITHGGNNFKYCTLAGIKQLTSASPFMLPQITQQANCCRHFLGRPWSIKTGIWFAIRLVLPWLPSSSKPSIQPNFWLQCKFSLIDVTSNMRQHTQSSLDIDCREHLSILKAWTLCLS